MTIRYTPPSEQGSVLRFGDCELHLLSRELFRSGVRQVPRRRVFDLLRLLIDHRPRAVSHADIAKAVWGHADVRAPLVAQAVMHARQLIGDVGDEPRWIVTVRGIGYRFAGAVALGLAADGPDPPPADVDELLATLADLEAALADGDLERAEFLSDQAIRLALESGINRQRARALALAAQVAITRGDLERAASLGSQALRLSESEGMSDLAAQARQRVAHVRLMAGDLHGALVHLQTVYAAVQASGPAIERGRCERLIALVYREMRQYEHAVTWCARARESAREALDVRDAASADTLMVDVKLLLAEALDDREDRQGARVERERALALNATLQADEGDALDRDASLAWLGNQAIALRGLDRPEEAWEMLERMQRALDDAPGAPGSANPLWVSGIQRERALLLSGDRRHVEAMTTIEQAIQVAESGGLHTEMPLLQKVASRVCEAAGRFQEALAWLRRSVASMDALQVQRATSQVAVLQAEADTDALRLDLRAAVQQAQHLALENRILQERVQRLQRLQDARRLDDPAFMDPLWMRSVLGPRQAEARLRDLPFCVALFVVENRAELPPEDRHPSAAPWLRSLWRALTVVLGPLPEVVHWRPGLFVRELQGQGERRARENCQRLQADLAAFPWHGDTGFGATALRVRVIGLDAARHGSLEEGLDQALLEAGIDSTHPPAHRPRALPNPA